MTSNVYFQSIDPGTMQRRASPIIGGGPVCGRGRHLIRMAVRDGVAQIASLADRIAIEPAIANGYVIESTLPRGEIRATAKGRGYLEGLARVE